MAPRGLGGWNRWKVLWPLGSMWTQGTGADQVRSSTMKCTPSCIRMTPATVQLLPSIRPGGQQLALLCALTDHGGTGGRCSVPEVAGGVQE